MNIITMEYFRQNTDYRRQNPSNSFGRYVVNPVVEALEFASASHMGFVYIEDRRMKFYPVIFDRGLDFKTMPHNWHNGNPVYHRTSANLRRR
jgi:hypothetical protein